MSGQRLPYQRISLAFSAKAKDRLADYLLTIDPSAPMMRERQAAVFIRNARSEGEEKSAPNRFRKIAIRVFPLLMMLLLLAVFFLPDQTIFLDLALGLGSLQLLAALLRLKQTNSELDGLEGFNAYIEIYQSMIETIAGQAFHSQQSRDLQAELFDRNKTAAAASLSKLGKLARRSSSRKNTIAGVRIQSWLDMCSEFEALLILAATAQCYEHYTWPLIQDASPAAANSLAGTAGLEIEALHHPLIDHDRSVPNDVLLPQESYIITGSNMPRFRRWPSTVRFASTTT